MSDKVVHISDSTMAAVNRTLLVREWWWTYLRVLKKDRPIAELNRLTDELQQRGIVRPGWPMPYEEAQDLKRDVDEWKKRHLKWWRDTY